MVGREERFKNKTSHVAGGESTSSSVNMVRGQKSYAGESAAIYIIII